MPWQVYLDTGLVQQTWWVVKFHLSIYLLMGIFRWLWWAETKFPCRSSFKVQSGFIVAKSRKINSSSNVHNEYRTNTCKCGLNLNMGFSPKLPKSKQHSIALGSRAVYTLHWAHSILLALLMLLIHINFSICVLWHHKYTSEINRELLFEETYYKTFFSWGLKTQTITARTMSNTVCQEKKNHSTPPTMLWIYL